MKNLSALDGFRGIAITLVVVYHAWTWISESHSTDNGFPVLSFIYAGSSGVTLFFILSGFLVTRPFIVSLAKKQAISLKFYFISRALRILPPYYFVGIFAAILMGKLELLPQILLFLSKAWDIGYFSTAWWSLIVEVHFYVLTPLIYILIKNRKKISYSVIGIAFMLMYILTSFHLFGYGGNHWLETKLKLIFSLFGQLPAFLVGTLLAYIRSKKNMIEIPPFLSRTLSFMVLLLLSYWLSIKSAIPGLNFYWEYSWYVLPESILWGGLVGLAIFSSSTRSPVLDNSILHFMGKISYSLYLIHMPIIGWIHHAKLELHPVFSTLAALALSIALAYSLYVLIEKPSLAIKKKLTKEPI